MDYTPRAVWTLAAISRLIFKLNDQVAMNVALRLRSNSQDSLRLIGPELAN
jgi:hypothetical protein